MNINTVKRHFASKFQTGHDHARHPEENDFRRCN